MRFLAVTTLEDYQLGWGLSCPALVHGNLSGKLLTAKGAKQSQKIKNVEKTGNTISLRPMAGIP
jgi:hypothetical protein